MLIRLGYDVGFEIPTALTMITMLQVHPSRAGDLCEDDGMQVTPAVTVDRYTDRFGNLCSRFVVPAGVLELRGANVVRDSGEMDAVDFDAVQHPVGELPHETLVYLLSSRYCEVDRMSNAAAELFGWTAPGWGRVQAICDWVYGKVSFGYPYARPTKTALDVFTERRGVCRDFQHLAITFCRAMNIPARYATGYLGDIGVPPSPTPMDFSAWFEVYLGDRWWVFDARHNQRRVGRVLMAVGRDATDVAITTSFGTANLRHFEVITDAIESAAEKECVSPG